MTATGAGAAAAGVAADEVGDHPEAPTSLTARTLNTWAVPLARSAATVLLAVEAPSVTATQVAPASTLASTT